MIQKVEVLASTSAATSLLMHSLVTCPLTHDTPRTVRDAKTRFSAYGKDGRVQYVDQQEA